MALSNLAWNFAIIGRLRRANYYQVWIIVARSDPLAGIARQAQIDCQQSALLLAAAANERRREMGYP